MKMIPKTIFLVLLVAIVLSSCGGSQPTSQNLTTIAVVAPAQQGIQINKNDAAKIGQKIWMNEGAGKVEKLTVWNEGDNFALLGIGHFIWYPVGIKGLFDEQFPKLLEFLQQKQVTLPPWLKNRPVCPWNSREAFYQDINSPKMDRLRELLKDTIPQQVQFIVNRLEQALPKMMTTLSTEEQRTYVRKQFYRLAETPRGIYALVDYVNFKGEGTDEKKRYQGQGWGLLQVLENMSGKSDNAVAEFVQAAYEVLMRRVQNAPTDESPWLPGWRNRLKTYLYL